MFKQEIDALFDKTMAAKTLDELEACRDEAFGEDGLLTAYIKDIATLRYNERVEAQERREQTVAEFESLLEQRQKALTPKEKPL